MCIESSNLIKLSFRKCTIKCIIIYKYILYKTLFGEFSKFGNILSSGIATNDIYINNIDLINLNRIFFSLLKNSKNILRYLKISPLHYTIFP